MPTDVLKGTGCAAQAHGQADPGGGPCPRCSRPRCCATSKTRTGERCRKNPHPGATICTNHGLTKAGRAKAAEARAEEEAGKVLAKLYREDVEPVTDPVGAMSLLAGRLQHVADEIGKVLTAADLNGPRERAWNRTVRELRQLLDAMGRLDLGQQWVGLEQERADRVVSAFTGALDLLATLVTLLPADRDLVVRRYLELLDDVVPGEVVA